MNSTNGVHGAAVHAEMENDNKLKGCPYMAGATTAPVGGYKLKADESITLYSNKGCPWAMRTWLAMEEANAEYTLTEIDLQNKPAWYKDINPLTKVPAIKYGDKVIYESAITTEFVADLFPQTEMMPENALERAQMRLFVDRFMVYVGSICSDAILKGAEGQQATLAGIRKLLPFLDNVGPFYGHARKFTVAELQVAPFVVRLYAAGANGFLGDMYTTLTTDSEFHRFHGWASLIISRESVKKIFDPQLHVKKWRTSLEAAQSNK